MADLCEAVRITIRYDAPRDFGLPSPETRRQYNLRFGQPPGPEAEIPLAGAWAHDLFWSLNSRRQRSDTGPQPLTHAEIEAWSRLNKTKLSPQDVALLIAMDDAYLSAVAEENQPKGKQDAKPQAKRKYP